MGAADGAVYSIDALTGCVYWTYFDTVQDFQTINGVKARGGSINSMAPVVAGGMLYINLRVLRKFNAGKCLVGLLGRRKMTVGAVYDRPQFLNGRSWAVIDCPYNLLDGRTLCLIAGSF